jgi:hypothetical protein
MEVIEASGKLNTSEISRPVRRSTDAKTSREKVVLELLETERAFVESMEKLQVLYPFSGSDVY